MVISLGPEIQGHVQDFSLGGEDQRAEGRERDRVPEEGQQLPPQRVGRSGECCELPQRGLGWSPDRPKVFHYFQHSG